MTVPVTARDLSPATKLTLVDLRDHEPARIPDIVDRTGLSERTVKRAVLDLCDAGIAKKAQVPDRPRQYQYELAD
jgi:predicted transcriptional regulator